MKNIEVVFWGSVDFIGGGGRLFILEGFFLGGRYIEFVYEELGSLSFRLMLFCLFVGLG